VSPGGTYCNDTAFVSIVKPNAVVQGRSASVPKAARKNEAFRTLFTMEWLQLRSASEGGPYKIAVWRRFGLMKVFASEGLGRDILACGALGSGAQVQSRDGAELLQSNWPLGRIRRSLRANSHE